MMISCEYSPSLENILHKMLAKNRINKVNLRKEFFRSDIEVIREIVEEHHGEVSYEATPEALEYRESISMTDEDYEFISAQIDDLESDGNGDLE